MKLGKILIVFVIISFFSPLLLQPQATLDDKITTINLFIVTIYTTNMGLIIDYYSGNRIRTTYLPNRFFEDKTVVKIIENNYLLTPQMNVVYRNTEPYKIKLYMPDWFDGDTYQILSSLPQNVVDKFKNTTKLDIPLADAEKK